jgi:CHAD domain-containing protein
MATVTTLPGARSEHRGLTFWMERVLKDLENVRNSATPDAVHDLRVALRRCRSIAAALEEVDRDPGWRELRKVSRKLFHGLGALRDAQVLDEWIAKLRPENDAVRVKLHAELAASEPELREEAIRIAGKFDEDVWKRLERHLRRRTQLVPAASLAAECLALERFEAAKELHNRALRTEKVKPWHEARIGLKRFRYTVESLLPEHHAAWSDNLKRLQDLIGDVHDLDVLAARVKDIASSQDSDAVKSWKETISEERHERIETYRQLTLGKTGVWNEWRRGLPHGKRLQAAALARLRATARAADRRPRRTSQISRVAVALFNAIHRVEPGPVFSDNSMRISLRVAARLHTVGAGTKSPRKATRKFLQKLRVPPGWSDDQWVLLGLTLRYHRGAEPNADKGPFSKLAEEHQSSVRALAGVLRLARALRKCGVVTTVGLRAEKSADALLLSVPGLLDTIETATRLAAAKHLLESYLRKPVVLKPIQVPQKIVSLPPQMEKQLPVSAASD